MDILMQFLEPIVLAIAGLAGTCVAYWIKQHIDLNKLNEKKELVEVGVTMIQQICKELDGDQKYEKAVEWITQQANAKGLKISEDELKGLIESSVLKFKNEFQNSWK